MDVLQIDGINIAPYKCFGNRGIGFAWVSDRVAVLPHDKLLAKKANEWELGSPAPSAFAMVVKLLTMFAGSAVNLLIVRTGELFMSKG